MARPDKAAAVAELTERFSSASAAVLTEYRGLTVAQLSELRRSLDGNATYAVVKNTLTKIAARDAGLGALEPMLEGPSAIAFVNGDPVEVARGIRDFSRTHPLLVIKGGVLEGTTMSADEIRRLADLESREVLLAKLAGALQASLQQAVSLFAAPLSQVARLADALRQKAEEDPSVLRGGDGAAVQPTAEAAAAPADAGAPADAVTADIVESGAGDPESVPSDGTPGVEDSPAVPPDAADDPGAQAQAVADAVDIAPGTDVTDATSAS